VEKDPDDRNLGAPGLAYLGLGDKAVGKLLIEEAKERSVNPESLASFVAYFGPVERDAARDQRCRSAGTAASHRAVRALLPGLRLGAWNEPVLAALHRVAPRPLQASHFSAPAFLPPPDLKRRLPVP
jgi:hypothetical protein